MAVDEDGHIAQASRGRGSLRAGAGLEPLGLRLLASIFGHDVARTDEDRAAADLAAGVDRERHHLLAEQSVADRDSGRTGTDARARLKKAGKKAIPSLVSVFEQHWKGTKWESDAERFASYQIQKLLAEIVKADRPGGDFVAKFGPGIVVPAADFERAARMWTAWWLGQGQTIETFKDFPE